MVNDVCSVRKHRVVGNTVELEYLLYLFFTMSTFLSTITVFIIHDASDIYTVINSVIKMDPLSPIFTVYLYTDYILYI